jgi:hypothetical protein
MRPMAGVLCGLVLSSAMPASARPRPRAEPATARTPPPSEDPDLDLVQGTVACPPEGSGGDPDLNRAKNRPVPGDGFVDRTLAELARLPVPPASVMERPRARWPAGTIAAVTKTENIAARVEGFIVAVRLGDAKASSCGLDRELELWLAGAPSDPRERAMLVEVAPGTRKQHPKWLARSFERVIKERLPVRVSGLLLLDPDHPEEMSRVRATTWEIHPAAVIEVRQAGVWRDFDAYAR